MAELSVPFRYALAPTDGGTAAGLGIGVADDANAGRTG